jgi:LysM domain
MIVVPQSLVIGNHEPSANFNNVPLRTVWYLSTRRNLMNRFSSLFAALALSVPCIAATGCVAETADEATDSQPVDEAAQAATTCSTGNYYYVVAGDTCTRIIVNYYPGRMGQFKALNNNMACVTADLYVGQQLCRP